MQRKIVHYVLIVLLARPFCLGGNLLGGNHWDPFDLFSQPAQTIAALEVPQPVINANTTQLAANANPTQRVVPNATQTAPTGIATPSTSQAGKTKPTRA